ncbi:MAG: response regulator transcription factor [Candidatus Saccharibacteria bacterium]|nr:response regulator transcription factor [Candidatus Saccharibacteria bacterium]
MPKRLLLIEDNTELRDVLKRFLSGNGFSVTALDSTEDGIDAVDEHDFDVALIDINLPGKSGFSMIEYIRGEGKTMPLIAMTARDGLEDKLNGFELGLTDYIVKPFDLQELLARVQAHVRMAGATNVSAGITTPSYHLNPESWEFFINSKPVELTNIEFRMMHILLLNSPSMVKVDDLVEFVWGDSVESAKPPIRIHLANLRKKIGDRDLSIIKTVPGIGYRLHDPKGND